MTAVCDFEFKNKYGIDDLLHIMRILRAPGGCPWDAEQNHNSIRHNFLEETYEVLEAIDTDNAVLLEEELGDVLLQVVFHTQMEDEKGVFDFSDVCDGICQKLIVRHPHVFGDVSVSGSGEVLKNWDDIKRRTKSQKTQTEAMASVPEVFPALMKSQKIQGKAAKAGFDWENADGAFDKLLEESDELKSALASGDKDAVEDELGDLLFSAVNIARFCGCEAETALDRATKKFMCRFAAVESEAAKRGIDMKTSAPELLDRLWEEAKNSSEEG